MRSLCGAAKLFGQFWVSLPQRGGHGQAPVPDAVGTFGQMRGIEAGCPNLGYRRQNVSVGVCLGSRGLLGARSIIRCVEHAELSRSWMSIMDNFEVQTHKEKSP